MSHDITITITAATSRNQLPGVEVVRAMLDEQGITLEHDLVDAGYRVHTDNPVFEAWWYDDRWPEVDSFNSAAEAITTRYPFVTIEVMDEWDGADEDEPGSEGYRWRAGNLVSTGQSQFVWLPE